MSQEGLQSDEAHNDQDDSSASDYSQNSVSSTIATRKSSEQSRATSHERPLRIRPSTRSGRDKAKRPSRKLLENKEAYRELFNSTLEEITGQSIELSDRGLEQASQIGASTWTSVEKAIFFRQLPITGRDNIKVISAAIGSKSELEVRRYIQLLSEGVVEGNLTQTLDVCLPTSIPAAYEIGTEFEAALEAAADVLSEEQCRLERRREARKYGDYWLLTDHVADELDHLIEDVPANSTIEEETPGGEDGDIQGLTAETRPIDLPIPAGELLNLSNWLEISQLFMWQGEGSTENWTDFVTTDDETPAIYNTAVQDFYNLTISLTRRLLQASIFQAQSRIRARDRTTPSTMVYAADVRTAAAMLNLTADRWQFWGRVPRRHGLRVYVREEKSKQRERSESSPAKEYHYGNLYNISHDELEAKLGITMNRNEQGNRTTPDVIEDEYEHASLADDSDMWTEVSNGSEDEHIATNAEEAGSDDDTPEDRTFEPSEDENENESDVIPKTVKKLSPEALEKQMDVEADAHDRQMSRVEELRLCELLNIPPPVEVKTEELPRAELIPTKRKSRRDLQDWRRAVDYEAEWEVATCPVNNEQFSIMQRRGQMSRERRRLTQDEVLQDRRSQRLAIGHKRHDVASEDQEDDEGLPEPPLSLKPAEQYGVIWSPTATHGMRSLQSVETGETDFRSVAMQDDREASDVILEHSWPSPAMPGMLESSISEPPMPLARAQSARAPSIQPSHQLVTARKRKAATTISPSAARRQADPAGSRQPSIASSRGSHGTATADDFLKQRSRFRRSLSRKGSPSNDSELMSQPGMVTSAMDGDVEMEDASDTDSPSSSDVGPKPRTPRKTISKAGDNNADDGWEAEMERRARSRQQSSISAL